MRKTKKERFEEMGVGEFLSYMKENYTAPKVIASRGMAVKFPYTLTASDEAKQRDANYTVQWTAFINNAGTLAHVYSKDGGFHARVRLKPAVKHMTPYQMHKIVSCKVELFLRDIDIFS